ncbi:RDD family protein [Candidatus Parabeggiatoa sp. HSG14]|uniref:RDD family protein n=1 Tax=Candidatus Parabeggiatoa sp. HSG14 TaxID=3055593 RepID=UPI0025A7B6F2|nr:RDD family protein [Thiotrichales bacterium HSG14]
MKNKNLIDEELSPAGLFRYLAAIFYDSLLLLSVLFLAAALAYPFSQGQVNFIFRIYLLIVCFFYFAWPWLHGGQTLGMKAWYIRLQATDGKVLTWRHVLLRFSMAIVSWSTLGIGVLWMLVDKQQRTWHDKVSNTCLVRLVIISKT